MQEEGKPFALEDAFPVAESTEGEGEEVKWGLFLSKTKDSEEADLPDQDGIAGFGKERSATPLTRSRLRPFLPGRKPKDLDVTEREEAEDIPPVGDDTPDEGFQMRLANARRVFERDKVAKRDFGEFARVEGEQGRDPMYDGFNVTKKLPLRAIGQEQARGLADTFDQATRADVVPPVRSAKPQATRGRARMVGARNVVSHSTGVGRRGRESSPAKGEARPGARGAGHAGELPLHERPIDAPEGRGSSGLVPGETSVRAEDRATVPIPAGVLSARKRNRSAGGRVSAKHALGRADARTADLPNRDYLGTNVTTTVASTFAGEVEPTRRVEPRRLSEKAAQPFDARAVRNAVFGLFATFTQDSRAMFRDPSPTRATASAPVGHREPSRSTAEAMSDLGRKARGKRRDIAWAGDRGPVLPTSNVRMFPRDGVGRSAKASASSRVVPNLLLASSSTLAHTFGSLAAKLPSSRRQASDVFSVASLFGRVPRSSTSAAVVDPKHGRRLREEVDPREGSTGATSLGRQIIQAVFGAKGVMTNVANDKKEAGAENFLPRNRESVFVARPVRGKLPEIPEKEDMNPRPQPLGTGTEAKTWTAGKFFEEDKEVAMNDEEGVRNLALAMASRSRNEAMQRGGHPLERDLSSSGRPGGEIALGAGRKFSSATTQATTLRCPFAEDEQGYDEADDMQDDRRV